MALSAYGAFEILGAKRNKLLDFYFDPHPLFTEKNCGATRLLHQTRGFR
jgi:hypothetical protein